MRTVVTILGTRLWWRHAFWLSGETTHAAFVDRFCDFASPKSGYGIKPDLVRAWERGEHAVSKGLVHRVEHCVPEGDTAHIISVVPLLQLDRLSAPGVVRLMCNYVTTQDDGSRAWSFPKHARLKRHNRLSKLIRWDDSKRLMQRGDFYGLLAILALFREAAAQSRFDDMRRHAENLYRLLPAIIRLPWVRPDVDLLLQCVEGIMRVKRFFVLRPAVDWKIFRENLLAPSYELNPRRWIRDPVTLELNKPLDVIVMDRVIEGPRPLPMLPDVKPLARYVNLQDPKNEPKPHQYRPLHRLGMIVHPEK